MKPSRTSRNRLTLMQLIGRIGILIAVLILLGIAGNLIWSSFTQRGSPTSVQFDLDADPSLNPVEATGLGLYLQANQDRLFTPVSTDTTEIFFEVDPGANASQIADDLLASGLISDETLFRNYLRYHGLDRQLEAGTYQLSANMTIPEIAVTLTDATLPEIEIRIPEGWRREQIADWIDQQPDIPFSGGEFLVATGDGAIWPIETTISLDLPEGITLEGFLFPDTYRVAINASANDLVAKMLINVERQFTPDMRADAVVRGMTVYEIVTLASIVEREAVVADERPTIASVYLNRLTIDMNLQADPTVQYAMGFQADSGEWWNLNLTQEDYSTVDSLYNTYLYAGLPPGPIASPGLDSIQAVIYAADTPYLFFRAACDGSGRHLFAITFEEHLANACP